MLHDRARIHVEAGSGGDGSVSFRREAHVPRGGPDGGDGGRGADVLLVCDDSLRDLRALRRKAHHRGPRGAGGAGALRHGADGEDLVIRVPPGTQIRGADEGLAGRSWDLVADSERAMVARGGAGGRGNKRFAGPARQAPHFAERGVPGEQGWLELRLKLLADVGFVGLPNAGKSSLLTRLTRAAPKVAAYPFTTLEPVLGVLEHDDRQLVLADIPGLIEGASEGAGLGDEFLAHIERTRLLVHVVDLAPELFAATPVAGTHLGSNGAGAYEEAGALEVGMPEDGVSDNQAIETMLANHAAIERELARYDARLARLPRVVALSKADLVPAARAAAAKEAFARVLGAEAPLIATSSATGTGCRELGDQLFAMVPAAEQGAARELPVQPDEDTARSAGVALASRDQPTDEDGALLPAHVVLRPRGRPGFSVRRVGPGTYAVEGEAAERLVNRFDVENGEALAYVESRLRRLGVLGALRAKGYQPGDVVQIAGVPLPLS
jgi:GTP-binding protein